MDYLQIVEEGNIETLREIYDLVITQLPYRLVTQPVIGKVSVSQSNPQKTVISHFEEKIATYCEVEVDGNIGYGCVPGNDPERAKYAAVIDSLIWNSHPVEAAINPLLYKIRNELVFKWKNRLEELCV